MPVSSFNSLACLHVAKKFVEVGWWVVGWVGAGFCKIKANSASLALAVAGTELGKNCNTH